jgi:dsDNA-specific endonuclease/ATPase MutS2
MGVNKSAKVPLLDLHGFRTDDVFDAVERFLRRHESAAKVRIMPGKGSGKVKERVIEYLRLAGYPWSFERGGDGRGNEGVLIVHME